MIGGSEGEQGVSIARALLRSIARTCACISVGPVVGARLVIGILLT
jgi:hypothetical protein